MHRLHRFADDFFHSHVFALRFAVGSQCPKFDSQTAMRYRVNYSLPQDHESPQSCWGTVAHVPEPTLRSKVGQGKTEQSRFRSREQSDPNLVWNHFRCKTKPKRSCTTVARFPTWCPHLQRIPGSTRQRLLARRLWRAWASVATRHSCSCACLSISPSLCVLLSECCLPTASRQC